MRDDDRLEALVRKMAKAGYQEYLMQRIQQLYGELTSRGVSNLGGWLSELKGRLTDLEDYLDIYAQGRAALVFADNGFPVTMNPSGKSGPDMKIECDGDVVYVEVHRFREGEAEQEARKKQTEEGIFVLDPRREVKRVWGVIIEKNEQGQNLPDGSSYVVYLLNFSDSDVGEKELGWAVKEIEEANCETPSQGKNIGGVLLEAGIEWSSMKSFHFWRNPSVEGTHPIREELAARLKNLKRPDEEQSKQSLAEFEKNFLGLLGWYLPKGCQHEEGRVVIASPPQGGRSNPRSEPVRRCLPDTPLDPIVFPCNNRPTGLFVCAMAEPNQHTPNPIRKALTRQKLLDGALDAFSRAGFHGTSVDDIVRSSGTSKGAFYFHFPSKEELFLALVDNLADRIRRNVEQAVAKKSDPVERIDAALTSVVDIFTRHRALARVFLVDLPWLNREFDQRLRQVRRRFADLIREHLELGIADGSIPPLDAEVTALMWMGAINEAIVWWLAKQPAQPAAELKAAMRAVLLRSIGLESANERS